MSFNNTGSNITNPRLPLRRPRGLLIEDDFEALRRRRDLLRMKDLDVIGVSSKEEALDRLEAIEFRVDVVLTDLNLTPDGGSKDAVDIAEAVYRRSEHTVPMYAYSGKRRDLPEASFGLFKGVVLKTASSPQVREVFNRASEDARAHFSESVLQAERALAALGAGTKDFSRDDVGLIRDLVPGSVPSMEAEWIPDHVGFLRLSERGVGVPYGITGLDTQLGRWRAGVIGHEYLLGYGETADEAVSALEDVVFGFAQLIAEEPSPHMNNLDVAVGVSRRLRKLILGLFAREEELGGEDVF